MCPCSPISFPSPSGPSGPSIPGFGVPFTLPVPTIPFPAGFPEDLLGLLDKLQLLIPPGALKPQLNPNFGKDIFDGIMKLLDQFMPFLMLYKFFLPILRLIICIIEVLCALMNPFALMSALNTLFTSCIPEFLNLFPIFALILMIISLLLLLLALIEYIIAQILKLIQALLRNINALILAFQGNAPAILSIAKKLAGLLCVFQNLFVLLSIFAIIIQIIKDILSLVFSIPPCQGGGPGSTDGCCAATYCPAIVQGNLTASTGTLKYLPEVDFQFSSLPLFGSFFNTVIRQESWQLYDAQQQDPQAFYDIVNATDVSDTIQPKPIYFPTDATFTASTPPRQAAYTVDLRLFYNPVPFGIDLGFPPQFIQFKDCIVLAAPTNILVNGDNSGTPAPTGVLTIKGGTAFFDDGTTQIELVDGYGKVIKDANGKPVPAQLSNFIHSAPHTNGQVNVNDGYVFQNITYTFKPNIAVLLQKNLVNAKCMPQIALPSTFMSDVVFSQVNVQAQEMANLVNRKAGTGADGSPIRAFPDPAAAEQCLLAAISNLQSNMTISGVAEFQAMCNLCLANLSADTEAAIADTVRIGFNPCLSTFEVVPNTQFTTQPIEVVVNLNENNGLPLTQNLPADIGQELANGIKATATFGQVSNFIYDGYQTFIALLTSSQPGNGQVMISFNNQTLCTNTLPPLGNPYLLPVPAPSHDLLAMGYTFVYAPFAADNIPPVGEGDTSTGTQPRRDPGDQSRDS